jgi:hypothetical protein
MKVSSPIGELPFEPRRLTVCRGGIRVEGAMGAWPAHVQIGPRDVPALARLLARPAAVTAAATVIIAGLARLAARRPARR